MGKKTKKKKVGKATLSCEIEFDREVTSADAIAGTIDRLLYNADLDLGDLDIGSLSISEEE